MFDYKSAWREEAAPRLLSLPLSSLQLVWRVHTEAHGICQDRDLSLPWPDTDLRKDFELLDTEELAEAAHVVQCAGHWHPGYKDWLKPLTAQGTYWRFSSYADEVLREKLSINKTVYLKLYSKEVLDGQLRFGYQENSHNWHSTIVGLATLTNLDLLNSYLITVGKKLDTSSAVPELLLKEAREFVSDNRLINIERFMK